MKPVGIFSLSTIDSLWCVLAGTDFFMENNLEITKIIHIFAAMLLTNIPKIMTTECINPQLPVPTTVASPKSGKERRWEIL